MSDLTDDQRRTLATLRRAYQGELAGKMARVTVAAAVLRAGDWDPSWLQALGHFAHRLAGSSGIWGYTAVSEAATRVEALTMSIGGSTSPAKLVPQLARLADALRDAVPRPSAMRGRPRRRGSGQPGRPGCQRSPRSTMRCRRSR